MQTKGLKTGLALAVAAVVLGNGIGVASAAEASSAAKILRVGTESTYAPFEFTQKGELVGFDIDLMNTLGERMGYDIEWVTMSFDGLIPALLTGQLDIAVASFTKTPERAKRVAFSDPYYRTGLSMVIREKDAEKYKTIEALQGQQLCAQLGSVSAKKAEELSPQKVTTFSDASGSYMELMTGGCEAVVNDRPVNQYFLSSQGVNHNLVELSQVLDAEDMAMVLPKANEELLAEINAALAELKSTGDYQLVYDRWFAQQNAEVTSCAETGEDGIVEAVPDEAVPAAAEIKVPEEQGAEESSVAEATTPVAVAPEEAVTPEKAGEQEKTGEPAVEATAEVSTVAPVAESTEEESPAASASSVEAAAVVETTVEEVKPEAAGSVEAPEPETVPAPVVETPAAPVEATATKAPVEAPVAAPAAQAEAPAEQAPAAEKGEPSHRPVVVHYRSVVQKPMQPLQVK